MGPFTLSISLIALLPLIANAIPQASSPSINANIDGWQNIGCFEDTSAGTLSFLLDDSPTMTEESCIQTCISNDFILAGLEGGTRCFCGNIIKSGGLPVSASACNIACGGNADELCGGVNGQRISIWEQTPFIVPALVPSFGEWNSIGCWSDSQQQRALHHDGGGSDGQTVEDCLNTCEAGGFAIAGVEFGLQCFCGNAILFNNAQIPAANCSLACGGNPSELCGGLNAINLYQFNDTPFTFGFAAIPENFEDWLFFGNTAETTSGPRAIPNEMNIDIEHMSVETCLQACTAASFNVGGLQFGEQCFCGNVTVPPGEVLPLSAANMPCTDNANEFCGSGGVNQVYFLPSATRAT